MHRSRKSTFPSIAQVLENGHHQRTYDEGPSLVITWVEFIQLDSGSEISRARRPQTPLSRLMKTIDLRGAEPAQEGVEHFSYIVCFPAENSDDADSQTIFDQRRPVTSRGICWASDQDTGLYSSDSIKNKFLMFTKTAQKLVPTAMADALLRRRV